MLVAIDVGNTRIKAAVFEGYSLLKLYLLEKETFQDDLKNIFSNHEKITNVWVSAVTSIEKKAFEGLSDKIQIHFISHLDVFPFHNLYATPTTLGLDRMVLAAGAVLQYPQKNRLIIDAGTCITFDFVDENDNYLGGAISPGLRLRYESLHQYTSKLPLLTLEIPEKYIGNSTNQSIHSGVVLGVVHEIEGYISRFTEDYENFTIILTGGDSDFLAKRLKSTIFANSNFLLESLNHLFQFYTYND
ncbi:type III pantothenate kinase [Flavobacterium sp.]|jgi:type III pantothenate kinase|uniref:type III pantothenate kinase n=1 Tax=Flavobacterium sp. TaxID=239 RepID=UPI0037BE72AA